MGVLKICLTAVAAGIAAMVLKEKSPAVSRVLIISAGIVLLTYAVGEVSGTADFAQYLLSCADGDVELKETAALMMKLTGIATVCEFSSESLKDMGENSLAAKVEFAGRAAICAMLLPKAAEYAGIVLSIF